MTIWPAAIRAHRITSGLVVECRDELERLGNSRQFNEEAAKLARRVAVMDLVGPREGQGPGRGQSRGC